VTAGPTIALSLISHTNAGKTTLARTLLGRDVGEVRDAQHVTLEATAYPLVTTPAGESLLLWDTPGFGDSARLARRLAQQGNPVGWFLTQVWDRFRDRAFWLSQQAVRNVREQADVVLYLVNASESPDDAGYLAPELAVLEWIGQPVIVLLNQTGRPRPPAEERAEEARWHAALGPRPIVHAVTTLDAFARCWVQEIALFDLVGEALPADRRETFHHLVAVWQAQRQARFDAAMAALAAPIAQAACDREIVPDPGAADAGLRASTDRLIAVHDLDGHAQQEVLARLAGDIAVDAPIDERKAAMMGGVVSGALTGLGADLATGGLSLGAGMLTGALLGAFGGAGVARGLNLARGKSGTAVRWDDAMLNRLVAAALLRYLAVAHYGRGRGEWAQSEYPPHWPPLVDAVVKARDAELTRLWTRREPACDTAALAQALQEQLAAAARETLGRLYPDAAAAARGGARATPAA
jgi:hypothetical protein